MTAGESPSPRRFRVRLLVLLVVPSLLIAAWFAWGRGPGPTYAYVAGRIEAPPGTSLPASLSVRATRNGRDLFRAPHPPGEWVLHTGSDGTFKIYVEEGGPVDLQVEQPPVSKASLRAGPDGQVDPEELQSMLQEAAESAPKDRLVLRVGGLEATARGVQPGTTDVVLRLVPRVARRVACRVLDLDGAPVASSNVTLRSLGDLIHGTTDRDGRVALDDVAVREYEMTADVPRGRPESTVRARVRATPGDAEILLPLRRGIPMRVRAAWAPDEPLLLSMAPSALEGWYVRTWRPDADGVVVLYAEPGWTTIFLLLGRRQGDSPRIDLLAEASAPVLEGAEVALEPKR